jgi:hypothetical protein
VSETFYFACGGALRPLVDGHAMTASLASVMHLPKISTIFVVLGLASTVTSASFDPRARKAKAVRADQSVSARPGVIASPTVVCKS